MLPPGIPRAIARIRNTSSWCTVTMPAGCMWAAVAEVPTQEQVSLDFQAPLCYDLVRAE
jgi:hypothetical protein